MDEPEGHYAKWNKSVVTKGQMFWLHEHELSKTVKIIETQSRKLPTARKNRGKWVLNRYRISVLQDKISVEVEHNTAGVQSQILRRQRQVECQVWGLLQQTLAKPCYEIKK